MPHLQKHGKCVAYFLKVCDNIHDKQLRSALQRIEVNYADKGYKDRFC